MPFRSWYRFGSAELCVALAFVTLASSQLAGFAADPGLGGHLATGARILETGHLPRVDPFLAGPADVPWVADQWLGAVILSALYQATSWPTLYAILLIVYLFSFAVVLHRAAVNASGSVMASSIAMLLCLKLSCVHFVARPVLFSLGLFALLVLLVQLLVARVRCGGGLPRWAFPCLPLLFLLWTALHPYTFLGLVYFAAYVTSEAVEALRGGRDRARWSTVFQLVTVLALCVAATFMTPYGSELHRSVFGLGASPFFREFLAEWRSTNLGSVEGQLLLGLLGVFICSLFVRSSARRCTLLDLLVLPPFLLFALTSVRGVAVFGVVLLPVLAAAFGRLAAAPLLRTAPVLRLLQQPLSRVAKQADSGMAGYPFAVLLAVGILVTTAVTGRVPLFLGEYGPPRSTYPFQAAQFLRSYASPDRPVRVANPMDWGGFLIWQGAGQVRPVIDDRLTLHGEAFFQRHVHEFYAAGPWSSYAASLGAELAVVPASWRCIDGEATFDELYRDGVAVVCKLR